MKFSDYSLQIANKPLIDDLNISFESQVIHHLLGSNGSGKSCFARSSVGMMKYKGEITGNENAVLLGSVSNVPSAFHLSDVVGLLYKRFEQEKVKNLYELLALSDIPQALSIKKMSDGQKQKIKLLCFLSAEPKVIFFDEFTNALDKRSSLDIYQFLKEYVSENDITLINITHNLSDIEYMPGVYYYLQNRKIIKIASKEEAIAAYVKGGVEGGV